MLSFFCLISFHLFFKYFHLKGVLGSPFPLFGGRRASPDASYNWQDTCIEKRRIVRGYTFCFQPPI